MESNTIGQLQNNMIIQVKGLEKQVGIRMIPKSNWSLLLKRWLKKRILTWLKKRVKKTNVVNEDITPTISAKTNIDTVNKTEKSQALNKRVYTPKINKAEIFKSINKSRSTQRTDTKKTVDKSGSIPIINLSNKITRIQNLQK